MYMYLRRDIRYVCVRMPGSITVQSVVPHVGDSVLVIIYIHWEVALKKAKCDITAVQNEQ